MTTENNEKVTVSKLKSRRHRDNGFEEWGGYMAAKRQKLSAQFNGHRHMESEDRDENETNIFKGVSIYVNGYTKPTAEELKRLMMVHGGTYHHYYSATKTSHMIASNLPDSKIRKLKDQVVVKPDWVVDSIKAGRLLPHQDYFLYTPEFRNKQQRLNFNNNFTNSTLPENTNCTTLNLTNSQSQETPIHVFEKNGRSFLRDASENSFKRSEMISTETTVVRHCIGPLIDKNTNDEHSINGHKQGHITDNYHAVDDKEAFNAAIPLDNLSTNQTSGENNEFDSSNNSLPIIHNGTVNKTDTSPNIFSNAGVKSVNVTNENVCSFKNTNNSEDKIIDCAGVEISIKSNVHDSSINSVKYGHNGDIFHDVDDKQSSNPTLSLDNLSTHEISCENNEFDGSSNSIPHTCNSIVNKTDTSTDIFSNVDINECVKDVNENVCFNNNTASSEDSIIDDTGVKMSNERNDFSNNKDSQSSNISTTNTVDVSYNTREDTDLGKADANINIDSKDSTTDFTDKIHNNSTIIPPSKSKSPAVAGQAGFLSEFYGHSRLHHISTAGQELKRYVQTLADNSSGSFSGREKLKELLKSNGIEINETESIKKNQQVVMHLDMDCFFVSVGLRKYPELRGKPVAVTHSKGKRGGAQEGSDIHFEAAYYKNLSKQKVEGVIGQSEQPKKDPEEKPKISKNSKEYGSLSEIASCSYEARAAGIRNGMHLGEALRRCPNLKTIPYDFEGYSEVSKELYDIVASYTLDIEAVSCDELYVDCTELLQDTGLSPAQFTFILRTEIAQNTGCTASAGLGPNMLIARLANRVAKPNGQFYVTSDKIDEFIKKQKVKDLPGVGYTTSSKFNQLGVITCGDLQTWSLLKLQQEFGPKTGQTLFNRCRGKEDRAVQLQKERKSVSAEINYGIRFEQEEEIYKFIKELSAEVSNRLKAINCKGKSITLKLMVRHPDAPLQTAKFMGHGVCDHFSKSLMLKSATDDPSVIGKECCTLACGFKIKPEDYRGIGIQISKLESLQKELKNQGSISSFLSSNFSVLETEDASNKEIFAPKEIKQKQPAGCSITDFLNRSPSVKLNISQRQTASAEELDESVLSALPEDLQKEIFDMYRIKNYNKPLSSFKQPGSTSCSSKKISKSKLSSKKGVSSKKDGTSSKQKTLFNCMSVTRNQAAEVVPVLECEPRKKASIGGVEDINDVNSLLEEWVSNSQVVLQEDVDQFRDYLLNVIDEKLEDVNLILNHFYSIVSSKENKWQQTYLTLLSYVQQKVLEKFGEMLEVKSDFNT